MAPDEDNVETEVQESSATVPEIKKRKPVCRQSWTPEQKKIIADYFSNHIKEKRPPKQKEVMEFLDLYPNNFTNRTWTTIKAVVFNIYTGKLNVNF